MNNRRWFSAKELSEYFSIPRKSILRYAAIGRFPRGSVIKVGKHVRFDIRLIEEGFERAQAKTRADLNSRRGIGISDKLEIGQ